MESALSESQHPSSQKNAAVLTKRKKQAGPEEVRLSYKLQFADSSLNFQDISEADFEKFAEKYPKLAEVFMNPEMLHSNPNLQAKVSQENWQAAASQLLSAVWKIKNASIFHAPVDPVKLGIPDYFDVIKHPMDFGTIKVNSIAQVSSQCICICSRVSI